MIEKPDPDTDVGYEGIAGASCQLTEVNEDFKIIFNPAGAGNMHRAKVSPDISSKYLVNIQHVYILSQIEPFL